MYFGDSGIYATIPKINTLFEAYLAKSYLFCQKNLSFTRSNILK